MYGRVIGYGTLVVGGTGGTKEKFTLVRAPNEFPRRVHAQIDVLAKTPAAVASAPQAQALLTRRDEARVERECPYCAELILARATRCRFCGQTVTPIAES